MQAIEMAQKLVTLTNKLDVLSSVSRIYIVEGKPCPTSGPRTSSCMWWHMSNLCLSTHIQTQTDICNKNENEPVLQRRLFCFVESSCSNQPSAPASTCPFLYCHVVSVCLLTVTLNSSQPEHDGCGTGSEELFNVWLTGSKSKEWVGNRQNLLSHHPWDLLPMVRRSKIFLTSPSISLAGATLIT